MGRLRFGTWPTPNGRKGHPAIVNPSGPGGAMALFEASVILIHLAESAGRLILIGPARRCLCLQCLMVRMGGVEPPFGQHDHFAS